MNVNKSILYVAVAILVVLQSCGPKTTDGGLTYTILNDSAGTNLQLGGLAYVHLTYSNEKDTFNSKKENGGFPIAIRLQDSLKIKGGLEEVLLLLSKGDSATFTVRNDSLYKNIFQIQMPKEVKPENLTVFNLKVVKTLTKDSVSILEKKMKEEQLAAEMQRQAQAQMQIMKDTLEIQKYCKAKGLKAKRTRDGVYYVVKKAAEGITLQPGDTANTFYTGKLLDGTVFDSNVGKQPFPVVVAMTQVIRGWHSGLMALKKGEKGTLIIPSSLAYGDRGQGPIPPNSILVFDIEVVK